MIRKNPDSLHLHSNAQCAADQLQQEPKIGVICSSKSWYSTHIKDAGIVIDHAQGYIVSTLQGSEMDWRGWVSEVEGCTDTKSKEMGPERNKSNETERERKSNGINLTRKKYKLNVAIYCHLERCIVIVGMGEVPWRLHNLSTNKTTIE